MRRSSGNPGEAAVLSAFVQADFHVLLPFGECRGQVSYVGRADIFGVFFPPSQSVYLVPVGLIESECRLRLEPARNNQRRRVRLASEYEFAAWTPGALANLVAGGPTRAAVSPLG